MKAAPPASAIRRRPESEYMDADEIETILRIQWKSLHNGPAYIEDYYYQVGGRVLAAGICSQTHDRLFLQSHQDIAHIKKGSDGV